MNPLVKKLEEKLLPEFKEVAARIHQEIPNISVNVYSGTVGLQTQYQGYDFGIECSFPDASDDEPDIVLDVGLGHLTTTPKICADVGGVSFKDWRGIFPSEGMIVSDELLGDLYKDLPRLYAALFKSLRRRKPIDK